MAFCSGLSHPSRLDLDLPTAQGVVRMKGLPLVWQLVHDPLFPRPLRHFLLSSWHHQFLCLCHLLLEFRFVQKNLDTVQVVQGANACNRRICKHRGTCTPGLGILHELLGAFLQRSSVPQALVRSKSQGPRCATSAPRPKAFLYSCLDPICLSLGSGALVWGVGLGYLEKWLVRGCR